MNLYIITGGPGVGKTTLVDYLHTKGFLIVPESARAIIRDQVGKNGDGVPWKNKYIYAQLMFKESLQAYNQIFNVTCDKTVFFDRGLADTLCYMKMENIPITDDQIKTVKDTIYNRKVFILPPWAEIYETDMERKQSWEESVNTYRNMKETYINLGYDVITVPIGSVESRYDFVLNHL